MDVKRSGTFKKEYNKLKRILKNIPKDRLDFVEDMINNAAFASSEMEKCIITMDQEGTTVLFKNGKQEFLKKHPAFDVYTKLQSQYLATMKELKNFLPEGDESKAPVKKEDNPIDAMMSGVRNRRNGLSVAK